MVRWTAERGRQPRLLIGDRQPMLVEALAALLIDHGYAVTHRAANGAEADAGLAAGDVDIAIVDIDLADPSPIALLARLRARGQRIPVVITAPSPDHPGLGSIMESAADGLVLKSEPTECLHHCLAAVIAGGQWFDRFARASARDQQQAIDGAAHLTPRERDVAKLVATGQRNRIIADALGITEGTVKMHLHNVYAKLGLESRTQLAMDERLRRLG